MAMTQGWDLNQVRRSPFYAALQPGLESPAWPPSWPTLADYQALLARLPQPLLTASGKPLRVVEQAQEKSTDWRQGYEPRIYLRGELQTRLASWHDAFNLLTWISFPLAKAALNARQYALLAARAQGLAPSGPRSPKQDALTQFDESGAVVLSADPALSDLLLGFQWKRLFWEQRERVRAGMRCLVFGHGLMERALAPYRGITAKGIVLPVTAELLAQPLTAQLAAVDRQLAQYLNDAQQLAHPRDLAPVPLLGFPGFTPDNEHAAYYDDERYFRPGRRLSAEKNA
jgi:hypothetical protein